MSFESANGSRADESSECQRLLSKLFIDVSTDPPNWKLSVLNAVAEWPVASETVDGEQFQYIIGGEAFNWKRLAERLVIHLETRETTKPSQSEIREWLHSDHVFGGFDEAQFRRALGVERWRGHLNYFYGVHLEQCLFTAVQNRIYRRRFARGMSLTDDAADEAYVGLYNDDEAVLWERFLEEASPDGTSLENDDGRPLSLDDDFTYWLFKRRIDSSHPAQVAYETQHGLEMLSAISEADSRRLRMLMNEDAGDLLEFAVIGGRRS